MNQYFVLFSSFPSLPFLSLPFPSLSPPSFFSFLSPPPPSPTPFYFIIITNKTSETSNLQKSSIHQSIRPSIFFFPFLSFFFLQNSSFRFYPRFHVRLDPSDPTFNEIPLFFFSFSFLFFSFLLKKKTKQTKKIKIEKNRSSFMGL